MKAQRYLELAAWTAGLLFLALRDPHAEGPVLCVWRLLGLGHCPGCGLGASIGLLLHGAWRESISHHWFGIPAVTILLFRIGQLIRQQFFLSYE
ncbi:DUF2752 domain-containing protein [Chitinophaga lutea]